MNTRHLILAAAIAAASSAASAGVTPLYAEADVGVGHASEDCSGTISCSTDGTSFGVTAGWKVGAGFAIEGGYTSFGTSRATVDEGGLHVHVHGRAQGYRLGVAYELPIPGPVSVDLRAGVIAMKTSAAAFYDTITSQDNETTAKAYYGLGASYTIVPHVRLRLGAEFSKSSLSGGESNVRAITLGSRVDF